MKCAVGLFLTACLVSVSSAAVVSQTYHGTQDDLLDLPFPPSSSDLIQGAIPSFAAGIGGATGFRTDPPATPAADQFPAYTDGLGLAASGLTGLLADNEPPVDGRVVQTVQYALGGAAVEEIRVYSGNADARQFSTFVLSLSTDGGASFSPLGPAGGYFQSDPTDTAPAAGNRSTLQRVFDDAGGLLAQGVDYVKIDFYASGNNNPQSARDPFDAVNPFTGNDDSRPAANQSPLIWEIDVIGIPEPATVTLLLLSLAVGAVTRSRRELSTEL